MNSLKKLLLASILLILFLLFPSFYIQTAVAAASTTFSASNVSGNIDVQSKPITIAIVDTGVDLTNPVLKPYLISGTNLIKPNSSPQDNNGHGTNVAGVIVSTVQKSALDNGLKVNIKLMPIKVLEADGSGDEQHLGAGITYAINHGARIVVLSLGLNKYSTYLSAVAQNAENQGVLLVSASGNEGNVVKYPAAYPTVLAVGGMDDDNRVDSRSNVGSEIDLVAFWKVVTTLLNGGYGTREGTSMAAPQVAAVCALVWQKYPLMNPAQVRELIRQTAKDIGTPGWDIQSGYGLLQANAALQAKPLDDLYENNDLAKDAKPLPLGKISYASYANDKDVDWYVIDAPYDGTVKIQIQPEGNTAYTTNDPAQVIGSVLSYYRNLSQPPVIYNTGLNQGVTLPVATGRSYIKLQPAIPLKGIFDYRMFPQFKMAPDAFEDNDSQYKAYTLPVRNQTLTGNFHQMNDQDWFMLPITQSGTLELRLSVDTARIDPVMRIVKSGAKDILIDQNGDGQTEDSLPLQVTPGNYYILVSNVQDYSYPVIGQYTLQVNYTVHNIDPNEPNDQALKATTVLSDLKYYGLLDKLDDQDWYSVNISKDSLLQINITNIPMNKTLNFTLYDKSLRQLRVTQNRLDETNLNRAMELPAGTYYMKINANQVFNNQLYQFQVHVSPIVAGFVDISGNWAETAIAKLANMKIVNGYGNDYFAPEQDMTRAEVLSALSKMFKWNDGKEINYADVLPSNWFYSVVSKAEKAHVISGFPNGTFEPNKPVSRMEMAMMVARALQLQISVTSGQPLFTDVQPGYWGQAALQTMKTEGFLSGYADGTFKPEQSATRAEFAQLLFNIISS